MEKEHRCVTWPQFVTTMVMVTVSILGGGWAVYASHTANMHANDGEVITAREFDRLVQRLDRIENKLDAMAGRP